MQNTIPVEHFGPPGEEMARAVSKCVHCGYCLPTCPTFAVLGEEMDSPRGRIFLMKSALEGGLALADTLPFVDRCLGCMACVTACPSGVKYGELLTPYRAHVDGRRNRTLAERLYRSLVRETLPYPARFRFAASLGKLARPFRTALPRQINTMLALLPEKLPPGESMPALIPAEGKRRARVALLTGCVQQVLAPRINLATARVLRRNGVEVVIPPGQGCCGALSSHTGEEEVARDFALHNFRAFPADVDAVVTNAAGCGSGMKEYSLLFKGALEEEQARSFAGRVKDVCEFLSGLGLRQPPSLPQPLRVAYHDACHLAHAQGITEAPRRMLGSIPNLTLLEVPEGELCCGSAGTYNLEQPALAAALGERKARNILQAGGEAVAMGNIGCMVQIQNHLAASGRSVPVLHTMEVLDMAYGQ